MRQHEADQHQRHHEHHHDPDEAGHQAEAFAVTASIFEAENETPERSLHGPGDGDQVGHLDRGELAEAADLAGDLDGDDLPGPAVADDEEVDLVDGDALGVGLLLLGVEVDARLGRAGRDEVHDTGVNGQAHESLLPDGKELPSPLR